MLQIITNLEKKGLFLIYRYMHQYYPNEQYNHLEIEDLIMLKDKVLECEDPIAFVWLQKWKQGQAWLKLNI